KSLGLSAEKLGLQSIQWGSASKSASQVEPRREGQPAAALDAYIRHDPGYVRSYEAYKPNLALLQQVSQRLPRARMVTITASWCPDCRRNVPRMARIAEHLPGWQFEVYPREDEERARELGIRAIPTFILYQDGTEIGRIVENPVFGSLEADLWEIVGKKVIKPQA
ncbi:MAG: thioredoxin family protein, partial [Chloroflexi bacterium]|nr:thioredoxin family protein [Chloroflexota bacterium]